MTHRAFAIFGFAWLGLGLGCAVGTDPVTGFNPAPRLDGGLEDETDGETDGDTDGETDGETDGDTDGADGSSDDDGGESMDDGAADDGAADTGEPPSDGTTGGEAEPPVDPACLPQPTDGVCRACAREHCCAELQSCEGDANCTCAMDCLETGTDPELCYEQCGDSFPAIVLGVCGLEPCGTCF